MLLHPTSQPTWMSSFSVKQKMGKSGLYSVGGEARVRSIYHNLSTATPSCVFSRPTSHPGLLCLRHMLNKPSSLQRKHNGYAPVVAEQGGHVPLAREHHQAGFERVGHLPVGRQLRNELDPLARACWGCESWQARQLACTRVLSANLTLLQLTVTEWKANTSLMAWSVTLS